MSNPRNNELVETTLYRAAETIGDISEPAMTLFYQRFPQAKQMFEHHGRLRCQNLEYNMVEQALYCLMNWYSSPGEVEIVLLDSVPHHAETLKVPPDAYQGLLHATAEVIGESIPCENLEELATWRKLCDELYAVIEQSCRYIHVPEEIARA